MKSIIKKEKRMDSMQAKTWKDLHIGDLIRKRRELENKIKTRQSDYCDYLRRSNSSLELIEKLTKKITNWDMRTEEEYYQTLFEIDCHFGINAFNDILALKSVEKQLLVEADKGRVEQMFFGSNHE